MIKTNQVTLTFLKISILASLFFVTAAPSIITGNTGPTSASTMTANKYADHTKVGKEDLKEGVVNDMKVKVVNERGMLANNPSILKDKIKKDMILKEEVVEDPCEEEAEQGQGLVPITELTDHELLPEADLCL